MKQPSRSAQQRLSDSSDTGSGAANSAPAQKPDSDKTPQHVEVNIADLQKMSMTELLDIAQREKLKECNGLKKQDLIFRILKERTQINGLMFGEGTLEILPDGFGFLRSPDYHYLPCPDDIYVSPSQIRRLG